MSVLLGVVRAIYHHKTTVARLRHTIPFRSRAKEKVWGRINKKSVFAYLHKRSAYSLEIEEISSQRAF